MINKAGDAGERLGLTGEDRDIDDLISYLKDELSDLKEENGQLMIQKL